jgi:hypothetical protein
LYGAYNPSGRLPYTIPKTLEEWPAQIQFVNTNLDAQPQVDYTEGERDDPASPAIKLF